MKYFLLCEQSFLDCGFLSSTSNSVCVVRASTPREIAKIIGGRYRDSGKSEQCNPCIIIPKSKFKPKQANEHFRKGDLLEFKFKSLTIEINPSDECGIVGVIEIPLVDLSK
jgi:hypothetical protein